RGGEEAGALRPAEPRPLAQGGGGLELRLGECVIVEERIIRVGGEEVAQRARAGLHRAQRGRRRTPAARLRAEDHVEASAQVRVVDPGVGVDRKSTRLNSSHVKISYAVFCL